MISWLPERIILCFKIVHEEQDEMPIPNELISGEVTEIETIIVKFTKTTLLGQNNKKILVKLANQKDL